MFSSIAEVLNKIKENKLVQNIAGNISENYERLKEQSFPIKYIYHDYLNESNHFFSCFLGYRLT